MAIGIALLLVALGFVAWRSGWFDRTPPVPPHPLTLIEAADIATVAVLSPEGPVPLTGEALRAVALAIASLKTMPATDSQSVTWGSATMLRAVTRDGVALSLQIKRVEDGAAVRVTADAPPGKGAADAAAIRTLRLNAYRVGPQLADTLLRRTPASTGTAPTP